MKTIEQKAKAYDKALNTAREILDHTSKNYLCTYFTKEDIKDMYSRFFPELKEESEDERIRKAIINEISLLEKESVVEQRKNVYQSWIVWLEKQGEQKFVVPKFKVGDKVVYTDSKGFKEYGIVQENDTVVESFKDQIAVLVGGCTLVYHNEDELKLVEQKPVVEMKTPEESLDIDSDTYNKIVDECIYGEQKSQRMISAEAKEAMYNKLAWSEGDDYNLQCMIAKVTSDIQKGNVGRNQELIDWLKSLKERIGG